MKKVYCKRDGVCQVRRRQQLIHCSRCVEKDLVDDALRQIPQSGHSDQRVGLHQCVTAAHLCRVDFRRMNFFFFPVSPAFEDSVARDLASSSALLPALALAAMSNGMLELLLNWAGGVEVA